MKKRNDLHRLMCCDIDRGVKKPIEALCVWLIADWLYSSISSIWVCHYIRHPAGIVVKCLHSSMSCEKCRLLPPWWIMNQGWRISVVTNARMGVWQQRLQFNLLSAHGNILNRQNLNILMIARSCLSILWMTQLIHHFGKEWMVLNVFKMCSMEA